MSDEGGVSLRLHRSDTPRTRIGRVTRTALLMILVAGALTSAGAAPGPHPQPAATPISRAIVLHGRARGLCPGAFRRMRVVVRNPGAAAVRLTGVTATVANASPACRARNVKVRAFLGSRTIPGLGQATLYLRTRMRRRAPNACQGLRFPVTLVATVTRP